MQCEKCHAELPPNSISCPACGAPALQNIEGFDNTQHIQLQLKTMLKDRNIYLVALIKSSMITLPNMIRSASFCVPWSRTIF